MDKFIPVKITDEEWANKLLNGEVFMRPLHEFGSWKLVKEQALNNQFRGDISEGAVSVVSDTQSSDFVKGFPEDFQKMIHHVSYIDMDDLQYFKIFCLYCLKYDPQENWFQKPDAKMREFGDTAIVIRDFGEFMKRVALALERTFEHHTSMIDVVTYYSLQENRALKPLFEKNNQYAYQNELRLAIGELGKNPYARGADADKPIFLKHDLNPITLQIGDIRDIAVSVPIEEFINLSFVEKYKYRFPMADQGSTPTAFDLAVSTTREMISDYHPTVVKSQMIIY